MRKTAFLAFALLLIASGGVLADHHDSVSFTVTIENISGIGLLDNAGVAAVPVGWRKAQDPPCPAALTNSPFRPNRATP